MLAAVGVILPAKSDALLLERLQAMKIDEKGMGFHAFRRFRKTWLRGERCQEDINNFWMGHQPESMSELYSRMEFECKRRSKNRPRHAVRAGDAAEEK